MRNQAVDLRSLGTSAFTAICVGVALLFSGASLAGDTQSVSQPQEAAAFNKAAAALGRGDYLSALRVYHSLANGGNAFAKARIGVMYAKGQGVPRNPIEAAKWYRRSAEQGSDYGQIFLGGAYAMGEGVPQNYVRAYMWLSLASAVSPVPVSARDEIAGLMTPAQIAEAQKLAAEWRPKAANANVKGISETPSQETPETFTGTAFFVSSDGTALTNAHVVERCQQIRVAGSPARLLAKDRTNDLALLATDTHLAQWANWRQLVQQGEDIVVYGFPLAGVLSSAGNVVTGNITALAGVGDDSRFLQISAPVQPGNSGGPLFDRHGNVVGVVVAKLNAVRVASATGDIPQNVNFAIKSSVAMAFLESQRVTVRSDPPPPADYRLDALSTPDIAAQAQALAVQVVCIQ
jgi:S1-C subfamily serine protease